MFKPNFTRHSLEVLEGRIAPAGVLPTGSADFVKATFGDPVKVGAGQVVNTTGTPNSGGYLMFVEQGNALVFFTDINANGEVDFNELTGISAGDGFRAVIFTDVHGDIVTNLKESRATFAGAAGPQVRTVLSLTDSDNNPANDSTVTRGDGRVIANSTIEKIELRSLRIEDLTDQNNDNVVDDADVLERKVESTYSIFGNIYAGRGFGVAGGGLIVDDTNGTNFGFALVPTIGSIKVGTATSGEFFSFGISNADNISGVLTGFTPGRGQAGGDIIGLRSIGQLNLNTLQAGDGGFGARGGNVLDVAINRDDAGGYEVIAGNGGRGPSGGAGGSILNFSDEGSNTSEVRIRAGDGGIGSTGVGGAGGNFSFETFNVRGNVQLTLGDGGDGFTAGGAGASLVKGDFTQPEPAVFRPGTAVGTTHLPGRLADGTIQTDYVARIGTSSPVDIDRDGFGDFVFTTKTTSQVVVMFGADPLDPMGFGGFRTITGPDGLPVADRLYLSGVRNPDALVVADLNSDGQLDIAVGSIDESSHEGIAVFLGQFESDGDDNLTTDEDVNGNNRNDFVGFRDARYSPIPTFRLEQPTQINNMVAGDFNGDGNPELAVVATYYTARTFEGNVTLGLGDPVQVLFFLAPELERNNLTGETELTGQFYAQFETRATNTTPAQTQLPYTIVAVNNLAAEADGVNTVDLEASALSTTDTRDVVFLGVVGTGNISKSVFTIEFPSSAEPVPGLPPLPQAPRQLGSFSLGIVDTDRLLSEPNNARNTRADATLQDFTVFDFSDAGTPDGVADLGVITREPELFLIGIRGDGLGSGTQASGSGDDNAGNFLGGGSAPGNLNVANATFQIKTTDFLEANPADPAGVPVADGFDDLVVLTSQGDPRLGYAVEMIFQPGANRGNTPPGGSPTQGARVNNELLVDSDAGFAAPTMFDVFFPVTADLGNPGYGAGDTTAAALRFAVSDGSFLEDQPYSELGLSLEAGNGGNSLTGNGGRGGNLGGGSQIGTKTQTITNPDGSTETLTLTDLIGSLNLEIAGTTKFFGGAGGNGFAAGGAGGDVTGVVIRDRGDRGQIANDILRVRVTLAGGDGGRGVGGAGGAGGDLFGNATEGFAMILLGGQGGNGLFGGDGGTVTGNGTRVTDAEVINLTARGGSGGDGVRRGGAGGSVVNVSPIITFEEGPDVPSDRGSLVYSGGDGGDAVSGRGGNGGSILNSSPRVNAIINDYVTLTAGDGGTGASGGDGGAVRDFRASFATGTRQPSFIDVIGGHAGAGLAGSGGSGGDVSGLVLPSRGVPFLTIIGGPGAQTSTLNRVLAGNGGSSAAAAGGAGGSIADVNTPVTSGSFAFAAGAGGSGLTQGGQGGSVSKVAVQISSPVQLGESNKVLVIAGKGGDASAFVANPNENEAQQARAAKNAFGGRVGKGGNGGDIINFDQTGSIGAHSDLIAGNGGDTLNFGTIFDRQAFVGQGGSVIDAEVTGDVGNIDADNPATADDPATVDDPATPEVENNENINENVPIRSYNNVLAGETIAAWVQNNLRPVSDLPLAPRPSISDEVGNVGIIVGAAGRNKPVITDPVNAPDTFITLPAPAARNGILKDLTARNLLSAVAGSVDRIASIQLTQNLQILAGVFAADKGIADPAAPTPPGAIGRFDYLDASGNPTTTGGPVRDGRLVDGAVVTTRLVDARGNAVSPPTRVFILT